jgi:NADH-ubiquinone oxidoreductase chain 5
LKSMRGLILIRLLGGRILRWLIFPNPIIICIPIIIKLLILFTCILGGIIGYMISNVSLYFNNKIKNYNLLRRFLGDIWFMPLIFTCGISFFPLNYRITIKKRLDRGWKEFFGGQKIYERIKISSIIFNVLNNNYFKIYFLLFFIWFIILFIFIIYLNSLKRALHWRCKGDCYNL